MDGITILSEGTRFGGLDFFAILALIFLIFLIIGSILHLLGGGSLLLPTVLLIIILMVMKFNMQDRYFYKEVKIIVDDGVSFNEVIDKYEIVEVKGHKITVRER